MKTVYSHQNLGELTRRELEMFLDFLTDIWSQLNDFEVWEAENIFHVTDDKKWNERALVEFQKILNKKKEFENRIILFQEVKKDMYRRSF